MKCGLWGQKQRSVIYVKIKIQQAAIGNDKKKVFDLLCEIRKGHSYSNVDSSSMERRCIVW